MPVVETKEVDLDSISMDELKAMAAEQAPAPADTSAVIDTPADPDGEPTRTVYQAKIDIGDGAGVQIFEADTEAELVQKLVKAQENATRKIRELAEKAKPAETAPKSKEYTADEEFLLSQELFATPSKAFQKLFQDTVGVPINEFRTQLDAVRAYQKQQSEQAASQEFVSKHSDYLANETNGKRMVSFINSFHSGQVTAENLEKAYTELSTSGLLELKTQPTTEEPAVEPVKKSDTSRIVTPADEPAEVVQRVRVASGLSLKSRAIAPKTQPAGLTEEQLYNLPLDKLKDLAEKAVRDSQS